MANPTWHVDGDYAETCSCFYACSCTPSNMTLPPNSDYCKFALVFQVEHGRFDAISLDDLTVALVGFTPEGPMTKVDWSVGLIVDERANPAQLDALTKIFSGQAGGPMAGLAPLITNFLGVESRPIQYQKNGITRSVLIPDALDYAVEGFAVVGKEGEYLHLDNTTHPANSSLALARSTRSHLHAFGLDWDDDTGRNNGHFAPFSWSA
jgi:hypothetical protein